MNQIKCCLNCSKCEHFINGESPDNCASVMALKQINALNLAVKKLSEKIDMKSEDKKAVVPVLEMETDEDSEDFEKELQTPINN